MLIGIQLLINGNKFKIQDLTPLRGRAEFSARPSDH
jgi:hypothetical protein